jgi:hypothetical protein
MERQCINKIGYFYSWDWKVKFQEYMWDIIFQEEGELIWIYLQKNDNLWVRIYTKIINKNEKRYIV